MKLALGTAQFGLDYGITNKRGKIPKKEVFKILEYALKKGIDTLDTAYNYGDSERLIGEYIKQFRIKNEKLRIVSKIPQSLNKIDYYLKQSLNKLNLKTLYGYLFHDFNSFKKNNLEIVQLQRYKKIGLIKKIGFSLYYPSELDYLLEKNVKFDLLQVPYNILDQRFSSYFPKLKRKGIEIHVRSVFLQGVLINDKRLEKIAKKLQTSASSLCINFAALNRFIDKIIIGVAGFSNLKENVKAVDDKNKVFKVYDELKKFKETNEAIILPIKWKS